MVQSSFHLSRTICALHPVTLILHRWPFPVLPLNCGLILQLLSNSLHMASNDFSVPQSSATFAVEGTQSLQRLLHMVVRTTTLVTGRCPAIVPIAEESPLSIYANYDLECSTWEDPWHTVGEINRLQSPLIANEPSFFPKVSRQYYGIAKLSNIKNCHARMLQCVRDDRWNVREIDIGEGTISWRGHAVIAGQVKHRERGLTVEKQVENEGAVQSENLVVRQTAWIPRILQGRKLFMRVFPHELQNIMHAFGEVRFCSADVLEFMEDAVRNVTQRVALGVLMRFNTDKLTVRDVSTCIRHDPRALFRLLFCLQRAKQTGDDLNIVKPTHREWDFCLQYATIHGMRVGEFPSLSHLQEVPLVRNHISCNEIARSVFWRSLGMLFRLQHEQCIQSFLTDRYSRCPGDVCGRRRIDLFREWLALPEHVQVNEGTLHALGNLAREAAGIITQTALVLRYRSEPHHSYERLLIDAIGFGIGAGVLIPLTSLQTYELLRVLCEMDTVVKEDRKGKFREARQEEALEVKHVREAWRQLDDPDALPAHRSFWVGL